MKRIAELMLILLWTAGVVIAKGLLSTLVAICFPPWALYLVVERALLAAGWVA